jgi:SAM-dependent methyltransferase
VSSPTDTRRPSVEGAATDVLTEFKASGLSLETLGGNSGKLRLSLDLAALAAERDRLRVLDVGCTGPLPLNLWEPFVPLSHRLELVGVDVRGIEVTERRARELGLEMEFHQESALGLTDRFGEQSFDAVVSTQVLEHVPNWQAALSEMRNVLRPGGTLLLTCDSGHVRRSLAGRLRLAGKRRYSVLRRTVGAVERLGDRFLSGEWERGLGVEELQAESQRLGLEVQRLAPYCVRDVKRVQRHAGSRTRQLWVAFEEMLENETRAPLDLGLYTTLYLRAERR